MSTNLGSWSSPNCPESVENIPRGNGVTLHHCHRMTPSFSFWKSFPVWDCVSWYTFRETPILSGHESPGNSEGDSLSWPPCYHPLIHIISHFHAATSHLHCVWTKSHRELPTCAFCQCHSPGMHPWSPLCLNSTSPGVGKLAPLSWQNLSARQKISLCLLHSKILPEVSLQCLLSKTCFVLLSSRLFP